MDKPIIPNRYTQPLYMPNFQKYVPSAFTDQLSMLEKINDTVLTLNRLGALSNDVMVQWNAVMDWVMNDGLDGSIENKVNAMLGDGTLANVINNTLFNQLNTTITSVQTDVANVKKKLFYGTPEDYGAVGDGIADDTAAIQACLNACWISDFKATTYNVTGTLTLPKYHSITGNHAELKANAVFAPNSLGRSVPTYTVLYMYPRDPVFQDELTDNTQFVRDLRITGSTAYPSMVGLYMGITDTNNVSQSTSVNFAISGANIKNVSISKCFNGLQVAEVWGTTFENVQTGYITGSGCLIQGQSVNNTFLGCFFATGSQGAHGLYVTHGVYNGSARRPEGNTFIGGYIGSAQIGVRIIDSFVTKFDKVIIDVNTTNAVLIDNGGLGSTNVTDDALFDGCYMYSSGALVVNIGDGTNVGLSVFKNCNFTGATDNALVGQNQVAVFENNQFTNHVTYASNARGSVINNIWNQVSTSNAQILKNGANIFTQNNQFKLDGVQVVAG